MHRHSFESRPRPTKAELDAQEKLDNAVFAFEDRLREALDQAETYGDQRYAWGQYVRRTEKLLAKTMAKEQRASTKIASENLKMALAAQEALSGDPENRAAILAKFKEGRAGSLWDRALIALSAYENVAPLLAEKERFLEAAKTISFHDWHDAVNFDNLKLPREFSGPEVRADDLFKYNHLVDKTVESFAEHGFTVPLTADNKLDIENLMERAYQESLIPEKNYMAFERDMAPYFKSERASKTQRAS